MRRGFVGALVAAALAAGLAAGLGGCAGRPPGVDGDLTNNWPPMPVPSLPVPAEHACYELPGMANLPVRLPTGVDCAAQHNLETVHVGRFTGVDAAADTPPPTGGPAQQHAYADCAGAARTFLGDDWRTGRLQLAVTVPTDLQWGADGRFYRCDLVELDDLQSYRIAERRGSLRGALAGTRPLGLTCFTVTTSGGDVATMDAADCRQPHNAEFAGVWDAPAGAYPDRQDQRDQADLAGCRGVVAAFARVPDDDRLEYRTGQLGDDFGADGWALGNRGVRCYLWLDNRTLNRSLRGAGTAGLPINYR